MLDKILDYFHKSIFTSIFSTWKIEEKETDKNSLIVPNIR